MPLTLLDHIDQLSAGGPGSGRHGEGGRNNSGRRVDNGKLPSHFMGDKNPHKLQDMHDQLKSQGYKHKFSTKVENSNVMVHQYQKRDNSGTGALNTRVIKENPNGEHTLETRPSK